MFFFLFPLIVASLGSLKIYQLYASVRSYVYVVIFGCPVYDFFVVFVVSEFSSLNGICIFYVLVLLHLFFFYCFNFSESLVIF